MAVSRIDRIGAARRDGDRGIGIYFRLVEALRFFRNGFCAAASSPA